jgi:hypothetical protein
MSTPILNPSAYPASRLMASSTVEQTDAPAAPPLSTGMGQDMVRGLALMWVSAVMAGLVLLTERFLLDRIDLGYLLGGLVLWSVLLSALLLLSRVSVRLSQAVLSWLDRSAQARARARSRARLSVSIF